jgi:hypothetical protein
MNHSAEINELKAKFEALVDALAPIVAEHQMREDAKRREHQLAEDARGKLSAGQVEAGQFIDQCGIHRDGLGRIVPASDEAIAAAKAAKEAKEREWSLGGLTQEQAAAGYRWDGGGYLVDKLGALHRPYTRRPRGVLPVPEVDPPHATAPETPFEIEERMQRENDNAAATRGEGPRKPTHDYDPF